MRNPMSNLSRIEDYQNRLKGINPAYGIQQGFILHKEDLEDFKRRHGAWFLGQVFHNIVVLGGPCVGIMHRSSKNAIRGAKRCIKIWILNMKRANKLEIRYLFFHNMGRIKNVIIFILGPQIN
jgi:hypothetical protein